MSIALNSTTPPLLIGSHPTAGAHCFASCTPPNEAFGPLILRTPSPQLDINTFMAVGGASAGGGGGSGPPTPTASAAVPTFMRMTPPLHPPFIPLFSGAANNTAIAAVATTGVRAATPPNAPASAIAVAATPAAELKPISVTAAAAAAAVNAARIAAARYPTTNAASVLPRGDSASGTRPKQSVVVMADWSDGDGDGADTANADGSDEDEEQDSKSKRKSIVCVGIVEKSSDGATQYRCRVCHHVFTRNSNLKRHSRIHTGEKRYTCPVCEKGFTEKHHFDSHVRTHNGLKPYACSRCDRRFNDNSNRLRHEKLHSIPGSSKHALHTPEFDTEFVPASIATLVPPSAAAGSQSEVPVFQTKPNRRRYSVGELQVLSPAGASVSDGKGANRRGTARLSANRRRAIERESGRRSSLSPTNRTLNTSDSIVERSPRTPRTPRATRTSSDENRSHTHRPPLLAPIGTRPPIAIAPAAAAAANPYVPYFQFPIAPPLPPVPHAVPITPPYQLAFLPRNRPLTNSEFFAVQLHRSTTAAQPETVTAAASSATTAAAIESSPQQVTSPLGVQIDAPTRFAPQLVTPMPMSIRIPAVLSSSFAGFTPAASPAHSRVASPASLPPLIASTASASTSATSGRSQTGAYNVGSGGSVTGLSPAMRALQFRFASALTPPFSLDPSNS